MGLYLTQIKNYDNSFLRLKTWHIFIMPVYEQTKQRAGRHFITFSENLGGSRKHSVKHKEFYITVKSRCTFFKLEVNLLHIVGKADMK